MESELKAKLVKKLNLLQKKIGELSPDGKNNFSGWSFISSNQIKYHLNRFLPELGIICIPSIVEYKESEAGTTKKGNTIIRTIVKMSFVLIDSETGFSLESFFFGADQDEAKSFAQAVTDCNKRFWFNLLSISEKNEDPDNNTVHYNSREDIEKKAKQQKEKELEEKAKQRLISLYKSSELEKDKKDSIVADFKAKYGEKYISWKEEYFKELEKALDKKEEIKEDLRLFHEIDGLELVNMGIINPYDESNIIDKKKREYNEKIIARRKELGIE